jgi:signal transduction histidine kinase
MPSENSLAIREDERVTRLYAARARDTAEAPLPRNDIGRSLGERGSFADLDRRLDDALEQRLCEPFSCIRTVTAVLTDELAARHADPLHSIADAAERAEGMVRDVLDFMRSASGGLRIARRRIDLKVLCERVVDAIHARHPDRTMLCTSDPRIEGEWDPERMAALLSRLVLNAIEHGPIRPAIRVELQGLPSHAVMQVWNAGAIAQIEPPNRLFEPFVSGRPRGAGRPAGLGLGLYLAREVARAHGGWIDVQSTDTDGTTFRVTVPRS